MSVKQNLGITTDDVRKARMVDQIPDVNWNGGTHIYGPSDDIPLHIHNLLSETELERKIAVDHLLGSQQEIGGITPYTPSVIQIVLKLLDSPATPGKANILWNLVGYAGHRYWLSSVPQQNELAQTYEILDKGIPTYLMLLNDSASVTRYAAIAMLTYFPRHSHDITMAIVAEKDPDVKAEMQKVYAVYRKYNTPDAE